MAKIPDKSGRSHGSVQTRVAGPSRGELGRVGRITKDTRDPARRRRRRQGGGRDARYGAAGANHGAVLRRWLMLGLILAGFGISGLLVWTLLRQNPQSGAASPSNRPDLNDPESIPALAADEALEMVSAMLDADTPEALEPLLHPGKIRPTGALARLRTIEEEEAKGFRTPAWLGAFDAICEPVSFVMVPKESGPPLLVTFTVNQERDWKIDFDATVGHCDPPFHDWLKGTVRQGMVRVTGKEDNYFNGPFRDDDIWACFALSHPGGDASLYGYCRRDGPQFGAIRAILRRNLLAASEPDKLSGKAGSFRTTLRLRNAEDGVSRQFLITEVIADDWVIGDESLETILQRTESGME
ncbi:hypothetical protein [Haloferula sp. A504]|uniref:hypothetical protein n=1 Tax=Haloferula sp. A504 TaxID=3373601 RepID=UPI0031C453AB|nr:hypothetical protein [Verrucomicrobiaceae bacterium E54]